MSLEYLKTMLQNIKQYGKNHPTQLLIIGFGLVSFVVILLEINKINTLKNNNLEINQLTNKYPNVSKFVTHFYDNSSWRIIEEEEIENEMNVNNGQSILIEINYHGLNLERQLSLDSRGNIVSVKMTVGSREVDIKYLFDKNINWDGFLYFYK